MRYFHYFLSNWIKQKVLKSINMNLREIFEIVWKNTLHFIDFIDI